MIGIYTISMADGRCYIGSSSVIERRWKEHRKLLDSGKHHSPYLQHVWSKYGSDAFAFRVIEECEEEVMLIREQSWIDSTTSVFNYARVAGSRKGVPQSAATIEKVRAAHIGRKNTPETLAKMSLASKGHKRNPGRSCSDARKAAVSKAQKGRPSTLRGIPRTEEVKAKCSAAQKGIPRPYARGKRSPEAIEAMRAAALANSENRRRASLIRWAKAKGREMPTKAEVCL